MARRSQTLYLPALGILAVVMLLMVLIGISTYRNLDREKQTTLTLLRRQGVALVTALEAGARTGMMMPAWADDSVGHLIRESARNEDVAYVYLVDGKGRIVHHSDAAARSPTVTWQPELLNDRHILTRVIDQPSDEPVLNWPSCLPPIPYLPPWPTIMK